MSADIIMSLLRVPYAVSYRLSNVITRSNIDTFVNRQLCNAGQRILNLGCGERKLDVNTRREIRVDIIRRENVDVTADAHALPFGDCTFDTCLLLEVLEHLKDPGKTIAEVLRILKPGGKVILTTRFIFPIHDAPHDYYRYTEFGLRELLKEYRSIHIHAQHDWYATFLVLFVRMIKEDHWLAVLCSPLIVAVGLLLMTLTPLFSLVSFKNITSGYLVVGSK